MGFSYRFPPHFPAMLCGVALVVFLLIPLDTLADNPPLTAAEKVVDGQPIDLQNARYIKLFAELRSEHGFSQEELNTIFDGVAIQRKVLELMDSQTKTNPYLSYLALFLSPAVISAGKQKLIDHRRLLDRIEEELAVDREYVIAIWAIESRFGLSRGRYNVLQSLNTLFAAYPRRSAFFRTQIIHFLLLCRENNLDPKSIKGSYAGAFGQAQFIPSSFREYAISFDGDERRDVFDSIPDIFGSIANYLKRHHWVLDGPVYQDIGTSLNSERLIKAHREGRKARVPWHTVAMTQNVNIPQPNEDKPLSIISFTMKKVLGGGTRYAAGYPNYHAIMAWNNSKRYTIAVSQLAEAIAR